MIGLLGDGFEKSLKKSAGYRADSTWLQKLLLPLSEYELKFRV